MSGYSLTAGRDKNMKISGKEESILDFMRIYPLLFFLITAFTSQALAQGFTGDELKS
jgi:hypothetical protein